MSYKRNVIDGFFGVMLFGYDELKKGNGLPQQNISRPWYYRGLNRLKEVVDNDKWICPIILEDSQDKDYYTISKAEIHTPKKECYKYEWQYLSQALHNMAHSYDAKRRLGNGIGCAYEMQKEELYAELVKFAILYYLGGFFPKHKDDSMAYFSAWAELSEEDYQKIVRTARNAALEILNILGIE